MIRIGIDPNLVAAGSFTLAWHGLMTGVAVFVAVLVMVRLAKGGRVALDDIYSTAFWAILGGIVGARLVHVIDQWDAIYSFQPWQVLRFWEGGLSLYGALCGGFLVGALYAALRRLPVGQLADLAAPGVILAQAVGRIGDIINGEHLSKLTSLPWGVVYTHPGSPGYGRPASHPVVAYEMLWDLLLFAILWRLRGRLKRDWMLFLVYASSYSIVRFFLSFLRVDEQAVLGGLHLSQVIALVVVVITVPLLIWRARRPAAEPITQGEDQWPADGQ